MTATLSAEIKKYRPLPTRKTKFLAELCQEAPPRVITSKALHEAYKKVLEAVLNSIDEEKDKDRKAGFEEYVEQLAIHLEHYEKSIFENKATSSDVLEFLMEQHGLTQMDLSKELGGQSVVSDTLSGKRKLNAEQIEKLSRRFHVSPAAVYPL